MSVYNRAPRLVADLPPSLALLAAICALRSANRDLLAVSFSEAAAFLTRAAVSPDWADAIFADGVLA